MQPFVQLDYTIRLSNTSGRPQPYPHLGRPCGGFDEKGLFFRNSREGEKRRKEREREKKKGRKREEREKEEEKKERRRKKEKKRMTYNVLIFFLVLVLVWRCAWCVS